VSLPIVWRQSARADLAHIIAFIAERSPAAARSLKSTIESAVLPASDYPYLFRAGRVPGTHEIVAHPNYIVVYSVTASAVEIINVVHARQQYPAT
jgi:toxin ParE1/3/4